MAKKSSKKTNDDTSLALDRHKYYNRKFKTSLIRRRWRTTAIHNRIRLTSLQKANVRQKRQERKICLNEAIEKGRKELVETAKRLHVEFGQHNETWFYRQLVQTSSNERKTRKVNKWNAYFRSEVKRLNEGYFFHPS